MGACPERVENGAFEPTSAPDEQPGRERQASVSPERRHLQPGTALFESAGGINDSRTRTSCSPARADQVLRPGAHLPSHRSERSGQPWAASDGGTGLAVTAAAATRKAEEHGGTLSREPVRGRRSIARRWSAEVDHPSDGSLSGVAATMR